MEAFGLHALYHDIEGVVAECGVFRGDFAKEISRVFPDRKLYLYDTFSGFDDADLNAEKQSNPIYSLMTQWIEGENYFRDTSVESVRGKLSNPKQYVIKKGFFPDTFEEGNERFAFVNLDLDLYAPIKAGLEIFWPLMSSGGVILVHDYYGLEGVARAVDEFTATNKICAMPVGDCLSVGIVKA